MGEGGGEEALRDWARAWARMAAAQADAAAALAPDALETEGDALWRAAEAQHALWRRAAGFLAAEARSGPGAATLARLLDPSAWAFGPTLLDPALRRLIEGPDPASLVQLGRATLPETPEWRALRHVRARHRRLVLDAWRRCFSRVSTGAVGDPASEPKTLSALWAETAGAELEALQRSPDFLASQRALIDAAVALRAREEALVAAFCEENGLPTRGEVDALHDALAALRREVRALKRELGRR